ncbi:MAG: LacI family DNA-binding transcriptional regulator [Anaerolineaceae bacterium]|nr:LacI family DNA-binding transcriptional regulator [Anaerolineaceae bacterium]
MPVTIKDIAKAANVSRGTVDRALNDRGGVNPDVAARIKSIAADMGYKPNTIAKALATRSNPVRLGVILNSIGNPFWDKVIDGINSAYDNLSDFGISMEIRKMRGYDQERQLHELEHLKEKGIDGLVITPISTPKVRDALNELIRSGVQVVCCNLDIDDVAYQAYVGCDYFCSGQTAGAIIGMTTHGESNLGIITSSHGLYFHEMRVKGCTSVLENYPNIHITDYAEAEDDEEVSYNEVKKMLLKNEKIDTLYFVTGGTTGGLHAIHDLHMEKRLRVFTFDQIPAVIENLKSGLVIATIDQQPFVQGATSVRMLFEAIMTKQIPTRRQVFTELNIKNRYNITG